MAFSERLRAARKKKQMTQQQVADALGITKSTYCGYETGKREPDIDRIGRLADLLDTTPNDLMERADRPVSADDFKAALWGGNENLNEEDLDILWADIQEYAAFKAQQRQKGHQ